MAEKTLFGKTADGREVSLYTLKNANGMQAVLTDFGAIIVRLLVPGKDGELDDVVLGYDKVSDYEVNNPFFGAVIGPSANRIGGASFEIDGVTYNIDVNDGVNNLHSHIQKGYHKLIWDAECGDNSVTFTLADTDGNLGFPGNKKTGVTYTLTDDNALELHYHACSDKKTILNLTNHTYFNLDGQFGGSIEGHELQLLASNYTPVVAGAIPTGEIAPVAGTPMDFTAPKVIGLEIGADFEQLKLTGGYDHNWVIDNWDGSLRQFAQVKGPKTGRIMKAYTTLPGVQFYAGNAVRVHEGKAPYAKRSGMCLETQYYPDSIHQSEFPSCVFGEDKEYDSVTVYRFE